jgi:hypothetical protein
MGSLWRSEQPGGQQPEGLEVRLRDGVSSDGESLKLWPIRGLHL